MLSRTVAMIFWAVPVFFFAVSRAGAARTSGPEEQLFGEMVVTSVSRKPEHLADAPAAVYVITGEEIRRAGHRTLADVLRLAPGLAVGQIDANGWAIATRGFNGRYNGKMLVLIDGRSVYTPLFGGVWWDQQDMLLEDIERIEVIRGPGGTLWGANALNGVVNVVTKSAWKTHGLLAEGAAGNQERGAGAVRYGGDAGKNLHYRFWGQDSARGGFVDGAGNRVNDAWRSARGGFRSDWGNEEADACTFQGDYFRNRLDTTWVRPTLTAPFVEAKNGDVQGDGGNLLFRWERKISETSALQAQTYYDRTSRSLRRLDDLRNTVEKRDTGDLDVQHSFLLGGRNAVVWGMDLRVSRDQFTNTYYIRFNPSAKTTLLASVFLQDEITLFPDRLRFTVGTKYEDNSYTGGELQPNVRLVWNPAANQTVWATVSRAVRIPTRVEDSSLFLQRTTPLPAPFTRGIISIQGSETLKAESLTAYETGTRFRLDRNVSVDVAVFHNDYSNLIDFASVSAPTLSIDPAPPTVIVPLTWINSKKGKMVGGELSGKWDVSRQWKLSASYSYAKESFLSSDNRNVGSYPRNIAAVQSAWDVTKRLEWNTAVYYNDTLFKTTFSQRVPSYARVDQGVTWRPWDYLEIAAWGQNLLEPRHLEFGTSIYDNGNEIPRSFYVLARLKL